MSSLKGSTVWGLGIRVSHSRGNFLELYDCMIVPSGSNGSTAPT